MSNSHFHPGQVQVFQDGGYFVRHEALAFPSPNSLSKAAPGAALPPRAYNPRTGGGHEATLARFRDRHTRLVTQANDLRRERDQLNAPAEAGPTEENDA